MEAGDSLSARENAFLRTQLKMFIPNDHASKHTPMKRFIPMPNQNRGSLSDRLKVANLSPISPVDTPLTANQIASAPSRNKVTLSEALYGGSAVTSLTPDKDDLLLIIVPKVPLAVFASGYLAKICSGEE